MVFLTSFIPPIGTPGHEEPDTTAYVNDKNVGKGTLYIMPSYLSWLDSDKQQGFSIEYDCICLHAISRDQQVHPRQCLYIMVDPPEPPIPPHLNTTVTTRTTLQDVDEDQFPAPMIEIRFEPDNTNNLDAMFQAMYHCQALNPDPRNSCSDAEEDIYEDAEEDDFEYYEADAEDAPYILPIEQIETNHNGTETDEPMDVEAGQFEDAEENP